MKTKAYHLRHEKMVAASAAAYHGISSSNNASIASAAA
jgi:hypothetical protein